jgi:hypothetical protein
VLEGAEEKTAEYAYCYSNLPRTSKVLGRDLLCTAHISQVLGKDILVLYIQHSSYRQCSCTRTTVTLHPTFFIQAVFMDKNYCDYIQHSSYRQCSWTRTTVSLHPTFFIQAVFMNKNYCDYIQHSSHMAG